MATISHEGVSHNLIVGKTIFDYADVLCIPLPTSCGRTGHCHECIVEIKQGMEALGSRSESELFLKDNYRLACQASIKNPSFNVEFVPLRGIPKILSTTLYKEIDLDPMVIQKDGMVFYDGEVIDKFRGNLYGLAIDLGTTTVVMDLVDLETGESLHMSSFENPQRFGGSDVMHRISYDGEFKGELRRSIINAVNQEIFELCKQYKFSRQGIYEIVVAGNSTMRDIFFKVDVQCIGQRPYKSRIEHEFNEGIRQTTSLIQNGRLLGLRTNPKAKVYGMPLIASHVGGDAAADLVTMDMASENGVVMLVDVGTNTEVVVGYKGRMMAASCPAGPAFEGGQITFGMPGYEGAIESVRWANGRIEYETIGDVNPQGICGSGLIDLLAVLRQQKQMTPKGVFSDKRYELTIVPDCGITFSREDASNLAQAKAANYCGQFIVMRKFGIGPEDVDRLYLAGGFANYVNVSNAVDIGFLAPVPEERIKKLGNAAVQGAREILLSKEKRKMVESLVKNIEHIELETTPDFFEVFVEGCQFKPMPGEFKPQGIA